MSMITLLGKEHDLGGGFFVRRVLPQAAKRAVGPFVFFDHMGPFTAAAGQNIDVRPHPHIGLSTLTYLFAGRFTHRDSLGNEQDIDPGEVNWMTAGAGISHSERSPATQRNSSRYLHGLQFWVALPDGQEECAPDFTHYDKKAIPFQENDDHRLTLVAGEAFGLRSPVKTSSPLVFASFEAKRQHELRLHAPGSDLALYLLEGEGASQGTKLLPHQMLVFGKGEAATVTLAEGARFVVLGGEPLASPRHIWWNLVSSSREKIEDAKKRWREGSFPMVPGETECIPLPSS